ncbi:MAG: ROK family transcriptional regulator [Beutenbergiaceae bacterium]
MSRRAASSQTSLRESNKSLVIETVQRFGGLTQVELVEATGLSAGTVSTIVKELVGAGVVETAATIRSGRRAQQVTLSRRLGVVVAAQIGPRQLSMILGDFAGEVLAEQSMPLPFEHRVDTTLDRVALLAVDLIERIGASLPELGGIALAVPAPVDVSTGMITVPGVMAGWNGEHLAQVMSKRLQKPVFVDQDANLAARAELTLGAGRGLQDILYVRASSTISSAMIIGGQSYRGYAGTAGQIGHIQVDPQGAICRCGSRGCLDTVVGASALVAPLAATHGDLSLRALMQQVAAGDQGCIRVVSDAGELIGRVLSTAYQTMNPQRIIVGGELAEAGEYLLDPMRRQVQRGALRNIVAPVEVVPADLGTRAELTGTLLAAQQHSGVADAAEEVAL